VGFALHIFVGRQESFSQGIGGVQTGFLGRGVPLGTNRLVIVCCCLLDRETVELITKHPDTGFISIETILYTHCPLYRNTAVALDTPSLSSSQNQS
jgi:hypothetical protein